MKIAAKNIVIFLATVGIIGVEGWRCPSDPRLRIYCRRGQGGRMVDLPGRVRGRMMDDSPMIPGPLSPMFDPDRPLPQTRFGFGDIGDWIAGAAETAYDWTKDKVVAGWDWSTGKLIDGWDWVTDEAEIVTAVGTKLVLMFPEYADNVVEYLDKHKELIKILFEAGLTAAEIAEKVEGRSGGGKLTGKMLLPSPRMFYPSSGQYYPGGEVVTGRRFPGPGDKLPMRKCPRNPFLKRHCREPIYF